MDSRYIHTDHEQQMYTLWEKHHVFQPQSDTENKKPDRTFSIIMPPPNANDPLHIGHAMFVALEDIMIRFHRMLGEDTLWLPGTDHAGIETQFVFEKKLKKQKKSRFDYDRQTLYQMIWEYVQENSDVAVNQLKKLGASADWSRFKFMLDPAIVNEVIQTFIKLHQENLVYRDLKLVNYCPKCGTAFSELEVDHQEQDSKLYYMQYGPLVVATTRPETVFGDVAVAVNPNDPRYQPFIGQEVEVDYLFETRKVKVIADDYVDPEFGTGALKITPFHDPNDFEIWQRHRDELPQPNQVIDYAGRLNEWAGPFKGLKTHIARPQIVQALNDKNLLIKTDEHYHNSIGVCYRCGTTIEPLPLPQFFIKVQPLVDQVVKKLDQGEVTIYGAGYEKILRHWLENLKDWNVSRQIVWGIRLPVWYSVSKNPDLEVVFLDGNHHRVSGKISQFLDQLSIVKTQLQELKAPVDTEFIISQDSPGDDYIQETDTFDTWFSSGQWPVTTLKTNQPGDFERFYPTSVMETGYDILPFWVMRMLLLGVFTTGEVPFHDVYLHGLVRDQQGKKMSKSKGNVINPLTMIEKYSADAIRMALVVRSTAGLDKSVGEADFKAMRNFTNKIWNASRFVIQAQPTENPPNTNKTQNKDIEYSHHLKQVVDEVTQQLKDYKLGLAAETTYNEFWHWFCDQCIEQTKSGNLSSTLLLEGLLVFLHLLHPFMPFVTESIWQELRAQQLIESDLLALDGWPKS